MKRYVEQLIDDIKLSKNNLPIALSTEEKVNELMRQYEMEELTQTPYQPKSEVSEDELSFSQHSGLKTALFPPSKVLNPAEMESIIAALIDAMNHYQVYLDLPESLPINLRYDYHIRFLTEKKFWLIENRGVYGAFQIIDFCTYMQDCPLRPYCNHPDSKV